MLAVLVLGPIFGLGLSLAVPASVTSLKEQIAAETGLVINLSPTQEIDLADYLRATPPSDWQTYIALRGINDASKIYPRGLLQTVTPHVLIAGRLEIFDQRVGGTTQPNAVLLATDFLGPGRGKAALARIFHHEVSSLLMEHYPFPKELWYQTLPKDFAYPKDDATRLNATQSYATDLTAFYSDGFVSDYGTSSLENDINTYVEVVLTRDASLRELQEVYPIIGIKVDLIRSYYADVFATFEANKAPGN